MTKYTNFFGDSNQSNNQKVLEWLKNLRPLDDDFMRELFRNNKPLTELVLRIVTGITDLKVVSQETQYDLKQLLGSRSLRLDVLATDSNGKKYNLEVQRADNGATPQRARYHSSALDIEFLKSNQNFDSLPVTYVIFITENDIFGHNLPIYLIDRMITELDKSFDDGEHIIYVNGAYNNQNDHSELAELIHDFRCSNADDMHIELFKERTRYYKEVPEGVNHMCKATEKLLTWRNIELATQMLTDNVPVDSIAKYSKLSIKQINEIKDKLSKGIKPEDISLDD